MFPLQLTHAKKIYPAPKQGVGDAVEAVKNVSFHVGHGEIFGLLGPNGAGKTSIISMITTLEAPTDGMVEVFGFNVESNPRLAKLNVGVVPQEIVQHGYFDVTEILEFQSGYYGLLKNRERIEFLLHKLSLWEHRHKKVKQLSGGMKRRLMIAKALVHSPKLLLLDEPTAGVDIELRESLWLFVRELKESGVSILLTTHYLQEAESLCDRVGILNRGELRVVGDTRDIIGQLTKRRVRITLKDINVDFSTSEYFVGADRSTVEFNLPAQMNVGELLSHLQIETAAILDLQIKEGSLEEAFLAVLGGVS